MAPQAGFTLFSHWRRRVNRCVEKILKKRVQGVCARAVPCRHTGASGWCLHPRKHAPPEEAWPPVFLKACALCGQCSPPTQGRPSGAVRSSPSAVSSESCFVSAAQGVVLGLNSRPCLVLNTCCPEHPQPWQWLRSAKNASLCDCGHVFCSRAPCHPICSFPFASFALGYLQFP